MAKRAERRHHKKRMKARARWVIRNRWSYSVTEDLSWAEKFGDHIKNCSCSGCGNPRQKPWKYRTREEEISERDFQDQLEDLRNG